MSNLTQQIKDLISDQMPDFIKAEDPSFISFMKAYYEWMDNSDLQYDVNGGANTNGTIYQTRRLLDYADIDKTTSEFLSHFKNSFLPYFPEDILSDKAKLVKNIREFYQKKGSQESLKFLFRVLYGQEIELSYPKENILRASDGKWFVPQSFKLTTSNTSPTFDIESIKKRKAIGSSSSASCIIEGVYKTIDAATNQEIYQIYVSNVNRKFVNGENLDVYYTDDSGQAVYLFSEKIIGSLSRVSINPNYRGLKYRTGDPVVLTGGLSTVDPQVTKAVAQINQVSTGGLQTVVVTAGGYGFRQYPNSSIAIIPAAGDSGNGAAAVISSIDSGNSVTLQIRTDSINSYASIQLSAANYGLPNAVTTTVNSSLNTALAATNITVGPIKTVTISSAGSNYAEVPTFDVTSLYDTSNTPQNLLDLGKIAAVSVLSGGIGYNSAVDTIRVVGVGIGSNAQFTFANNASGTITSVTVTQSGEGYSTNPELAITSSTGSGAQLRGYLYGDGETLTATVDQIGRIQNFILLNRGSGYISQPNVSLRIKDVTIASVGETIGLISEGDYVYQGTSPNVGNYTFYATVDSYDSANSKVRMYNYIGNLDVTANLKFDTFNVAVSGLSSASVITYGNGQARANAEFLDGLLKSNGYFLNTDGFLSADKKLQDSDKYHNFSYVIVAEKALESYRKSLLDILHPSGTKLIGYNQLINTEDDIVAPTSNVYSSNTSNSSGTVDASVFVYNLQPEFKMNLKFNSNNNSTIFTDSVGNYTEITYRSFDGAAQPSQNSTTQYFSNTLFIPNSTKITVSRYSGSYLIVPVQNTIFNTANSWCVEGFYYSTNQVHPDATSQTIWSYGDSSPGGALGPKLKLQLSTSSRTLTLAISDSGPNGSFGGFTSLTSVAGVISSNSWNHIAVVHDKPNKRFRIYSNGIFRAETNAPYTTTANNILSGNLTIGGEALSNTQGIFAPGYYDEFTIRSTIPYTSNSVANVSTYTVPTEPFNHLQVILQTTTQDGFAVAGNNTVFTTAKANDLIVIDSANESRKQVKRIISIANSTSMNIESSTAYIGDGRLTTNSSSNDVIVISNTSSISIQAGDYISYNIASNVYIALVSSVSGNNLTLNATPYSSNTGVLYLVYPTFNDVSYEIISTD